MIAIIDYDAGNIRSVEKACAHLGQKALLTRERSEILKADRIILPGDGNFGFAMEMLKKFDLIDTIREAVSKEIPFLGICLGLQVLYESSEESPGVEGLGLIKGKVKEFDRKKGMKVPEIGWNSLRINPDGRLFKGVEDGSHVYFVHSFYGYADDRDIVKASCEYANIFDASIEKGNLFACQFHPEKSGNIGLGILENFFGI